MAATHVEPARHPVAPGVSLHVLDGEGVPAGPGGVAFLLVHGLASNARLWDGVAAALRGAGHRVAAVDLRGHGLSDKPDHGYDMARVADDLRVLIYELALGRPVVAGQSWGGNVVLELAFRAPEAVRGIACVDGGWIELQDHFSDWESCQAVMRPPPLAGSRFEDIERMVRTMHPDWREEAITGALANFERRSDGTVAPWLTLDRHLAVLRGLWDHRPSTRYSAVRTPALLVPADDPMSDHLRRHAAVDAAGTRLPTSRTHWFAGDHDIHAQHPEEVAAVLLDSVADGFFA